MSNREQMLAIIAMAKAKHAARMAELAKAKETTGAAIRIVANDDACAVLKEAIAKAVLVTAEGVELDETQAAAITAIESGESICLIGAAGTGKTTVTQEAIIRSLQRVGMTTIGYDTKYLTKGSPSIAILGFTNRAVNNIRKKLPDNIKGHCLTFHKLLEFGPVFYEGEDENGNTKQRMRFEPKYTKVNKLPHLSCVYLEESSMTGTDLFKLFIDALPDVSKTQFVFLGDLNQLKPVFGDSILGYKLTELKTVELSTVHRTALRSPITALATAVRLNKVAYNKEAAWSSVDNFMLPKCLTKPVEIATESGRVLIRPWQKRVSDDYATKVLGKLFPQMIEAGLYDPLEDMILIPFNKAFGTLEINKYIAGFISSRDNHPTFEVIARYNKSYWAVGDRVMVDKMEGIITSIVPNKSYFGTATQPSSLKLTRWGHNPDSPISKLPTAEQALAALEALENMDEDSSNAASHVITIRMSESDSEIEVSTAGEINSLILSYAITVHKAQGSEWRRVFFVMHASHNVMLSRELVYTAVTRAREELIVFTEGDIEGKPNSLLIAAGRPSIPGTSLSEKIAYFTRKSESRVRYN